jgi:hypothetical protein
VDPKLSSQGFVPAGIAFAATCISSKQINKLTGHGFQPQLFFSIHDISEMMNPSFKCVLTAMLDDNMGVTHTEVRPKNPRRKATDQAETGAIGYLPPQMLGQNTPQEPVEAGRSRGLPPVN